jgi:hypothetical protein
VGGLAVQRSVESAARPRGPATRDDVLPADDWLVRIVDHFRRADLTFVFDGFRPLGVDGHRDAAVFGNVFLQGPPMALELTGNLLVDDGYVAIPEFGTAGPGLVDVTTPAPVIGEPLRVVPDGGVFQNLAITNLMVTAGEGAWFIADQARVQLSGQLVVNKVGTAIPIVGTLTGTRGQYTLIAPSQRLLVLRMGVTRDHTRVHRQVFDLLIALLAD